MPDAADGRDDRLAGMRRQLDDLACKNIVRQRTLPFGLSALDASLPAGGLRCGGVHEVGEVGPSAEYAALSALFAAAVL
ncbi:damage-inducible mutagenesis protein, partial [Methylobacterium trifolii]